MGKEFIGGARWGTERSYRLRKAANRSECRGSKRVKGSKGKGNLMKRSLRGALGSSPPLGGSGFQAKIGKMGKKDKKIKEIKGILKIC